MMSAEGRKTELGWEKGMDLSQMNTVNRHVGLPLSQSPSGTLRGEMALCCLLFWGMGLLSFQGDV